MKLIDMTTENDSGQNIANDLKHFHVEKSLILSAVLLLTDRTSQKFGPTYSFKGFSLFLIFSTL